MEFTKMHGLGNDFIVLDGKDLPEADYGQLAVKLCDRRLGVGADGILLVLPSKTEDIRMRIINSDGSEADMCGNGIRCFAKYVFEKGIIDKERFRIETFAGTMVPRLNTEAGKVVSVKVDMGQPVFERGRIPMTGPAGKVINEALNVDGKIYPVTSMLMGVPHTVVFVDELREDEILEVGPIIERHAVFPKKTNVNFVKVDNRCEIEVRTWERGAGRTLACGTGSCASVVAAFLNNKTDRMATVHLEKGDLFIEYAEDGTVFMSGPAEEVFTGTLSE
ncbi:MAG TPA: diaminopimelate epimerase [Bacillota bacterium]|nr:diaminopimelate epimerase [Bacillota bacterium]